MRSSVPTSGPCVTGHSHRGAAVQRELFLPVAVTACHEEEGLAHRRGLLEAITMMK